MIIDRVAYFLLWIVMGVIKALFWCADKVRSFIRKENQ